MLFLLQLDTFYHLRCARILCSRHLPNEHEVATIHILHPDLLHKELKDYIISIDNLVVVHCIIYENWMVK